MCSQACVSIPATFCIWTQHTRDLGRVSASQPPYWVWTQHNTRAALRLAQMEAEHGSGGGGAENGVSARGQGLLAQHLQALLDTLPPQALAIANMRLGLDRDRAASCLQASRVLGVSGGRPASGEDVDHATAP